MFQPKGGQTDNGAENRAHASGQQDHQRPGMGQQHMVFAQHPGERGDGIGADADKGRMTDGDQAGKAGDQIQPHDGNDRHQDIIDNQHVFVVQLE